MSKTISRQDIRECLEALKQLPDFDRYPLPKSIHKEFNIPMTGYITKNLNDYLTMHHKTIALPGGKMETRVPTDTTLRHVPSAEPVPVETITGSADEIEKRLSGMTVLSTESNSSEPPANQLVPNPPASDDAEDTTDDETH